MASTHSRHLDRHLLRQALDALPAPVLVVAAGDSHWPILYANDAMAVLAGMVPAELIGRPFAVLAADVPAVDATGPWRLRCPAGDVVELAAAPLYQHPGQPACWLLTAASAAVAVRPAAGVVPAATVEAAPSSRDAGEAWLQGPRDDRRDPATGLPGRAAFADVLARDLALARREQRQITVAVFRIDAFTAYAALFGRHATDACLRKVSRAIGSLLRRAGDYAARVGPDRFAVLMAGGDEASHRGHAGRIAQRVRALAIHHPRSLPARYVTVSWELVSLVPPRVAGRSTLLEQAEAGLAMAGSDAGDTPAVRCRQSPAL